MARKDLPCRRWCEVSSTRRMDGESTIIRVVEGRLDTVRADEKVYERKEWMKNNLKAYLDSVSGARKDNSKGMEEVVKEQRQDSGDVQQTRHGGSHGSIGAAGRHGGGRDEGFSKSRWPFVSVEKEV